MENTKDEQELSAIEELTVKLRNRDKAITFLDKEVRSLRSQLDKKPLLSEIAELKKQIADLEEKYRNMMRFSKGERHEIQKVEQVARLTNQLQQCQSKNERLQKDNENLINKFYAELNKNNANNV